ncbi:hypothetical protein ACFWY5_29750 [Nonomuraea sp. NPDC059007]|uniref:hypothetical protein n=1 Tax=Nonomuraea sp. NPDC059007 TaxID=3346692 RepID=UPI0036801399
MTYGVVSESTQALDPELFRLATDFTFVEWDSDQEPAGDEWHLTEGFYETPDGRQFVESDLMEISVTASGALDETFLILPAYFDSVWKALYNALPIQVSEHEEWELAANWGGSPDTIARAVGVGYSAKWRQDNLAA